MLHTSIVLYIWEWIFMNKEAKVDILTSLSSIILAPGRRGLSSIAAALQHLKPITSTNGADFNVWAVSQQMVQTAMVGLPCKIRIHSSLNFQFFFFYNLKADVLPLPIITVMIRSLCWSLELMVPIALCSILRSCAVQYHFVMLLS